MMWLVNLAALALLAFIVWWFWLSKPGAQKIAVGDAIDIIVDGGVYSPARIEVSRGQPVVLRFIRRDASPCAEKVVFNDLDISLDLALGKPQELSLTPDRNGTFSFTCQMGMYRGLLVVQ